MFDLDTQLCSVWLDGTSGIVDAIPHIGQCFSNAILWTAITIVNLFVVGLMAIIFLASILMMLDGTCRLSLRFWKWLKFKFNSTKSQNVSDLHQTHTESRNFINVSESSFSDDIPIKYPEQDRLGFNPLAQSIASCIRHLQDPVGSVIAVYGPWGSGKSSVVHLILHNLRNLPDQEKENAPTIIEFSSWSYRTEDGIVFGFFQELYAGLESTLSRSRKAKIAFDRMSFGALNSSNTTTISSISNAISGNVFGSIILTSFWLIQYAWSIIEVFLYGERKSKSLQDIVNEELSKCENPLLFVVDDIDRLSPDEALSIFRIIKSVGRLNNVIYLLSYDRDRVENLIDKIYPSEGSEYLEKIVQAGFDIPKPTRGELIEILKFNLDKLLSEMSNEMSSRVESVISKVVFPEIKTPRDVHRLTNTLSITYNSVKGKIDIADFLGIETLRLFRPLVYHAVRANRDLFVGARKFASVKHDVKISQRYRNMIFGSKLIDDEERVKQALAEIFPVLNQIWYGKPYTYSGSWETEYRVCTDSNFDKYFGLFSRSRTITQVDIHRIAENAQSEDYIKKTFLDAVSVPDLNERTKASFLLDELEHYDTLFEASSVNSIVRILFSIADDLDVVADERKGAISSESNRSRLFRAAKVLLYSKNQPQDAFSQIISSCDSASFSFSIYVYEKCCNEKDIHSGSRIVSDDMLENFKASIIGKIHNAISTNSFLDCKDPLYVLCQWRSMTTDRSGAVRSTLLYMLSDHMSVIKLCHNFCRKFSYREQMRDDEMIYEVAFLEQLVEVYRMLEEADFHDCLTRKVSRCTDQEEIEVIENAISIWNHICDIYKSV